ncbi:oxidoreductase [Sphingomonas metalli]|uniref:Oxidoreductase n=1 Tax=Sphingomonas metalli TaxID=1779358 RepID=A0A916T2T4_9SPHN|nr:sulfite reductase flavoprotein subunit alpha [Sphingomonas metalli]GGB26247.1 oxidoreductase [Sphingomonas metalli]
MTRIILFQIHWFLGITAGLVLAVMGVTGAMMSFEDEIAEAVSPGIYAPGVPARPDLTPDRLIARAEAAHPGFRVTRLDWETPRERSHGVTLVAAKGRGREQGRIDRATGAWLGESAAAPVFETAEGLHRWLALPGGGGGIGRQITGFSAIALIFFALSGLYLRWPKRAVDWRAWLVLDWRKSGRNLWRALHVTIGTWVLAFYLLSALTGMWWSYDWYRRGVSAMLGAEPREEARGGKGRTQPAARPAIDPAWRAFRTATGDRYVWIRIARPAPDRPMKEISFEARRAEARHLRQIDRFTYTPAGRRTSADLYAARPLGKVLTQSMFELHRGAFFGLPGRVVMLLTSLTMPLFTVTGFLLYLSRRRRRRAGRDNGPALPAASGKPILVAYASQTGHAELHARNAAAALARGGVPVQLEPLARVDAALLARTERALFVVSTYGEGEPPDTARGFVRKVMAAPAGLTGLTYGILALGDREYRDFCAFGRALDAWLASSDATPIFEPILVDGEDPDALERWRRRLHALGAAEAGRGQQAEGFGRWTLVSRTPLNPGSAHARAFHLRFEPSGDALPEWEAGDIVEVRPQNDPARVEAALARFEQAGDGEVMLDRADLRVRLAGAILSDTMGEPEGLRPLPPREYSAASIPADGTLDLVVRQVRGADGGYGIGSGWLTEHLPVGATTALRLRANPGFRVPPRAGSLILIGNGTGIAGLRAHLKAAARRGSRGHWLFFGERERAHDGFFADEIAGWIADGTLARADRCWSREADCGRYVQHLLFEEGPALIAAIDAGAAILVCGSLEGMAPAVHATLAALVGEARLESLAEAGRYRRDVY